MVMRRTDARRRRVLSEEFVPTNESVVSNDNKPMRAYSFGANRRNQPKTTDLIPKRRLSLSLFFLFVVLCIATINVLALSANSLTEVIGEAGAESFAIFGPGTLANWLCCVSLFLCAGICLQLYLLRQHKRDDYAGMYRVWILMSIMFVLASIDCVIDLQTPTAKLFEHLTHRSLLQTPWLTMAIEMIVLGLIVIRMLFEVRVSKASLAAVVAVWIGFVGCIVLRNVQFSDSLAGITQNMAYGNCILLGCVGSQVALTMYTRFVFLHAHGLIQIKVKAAKPKLAADTAPEVKKTAKRKNPTPAKAKTKVEPAKPKVEEVEPETIEFSQPVKANPPAPKTKSKRQKRKAATKPVPVPAPEVTPEPVVEETSAFETFEPESPPTRSKSKRKKAAAKQASTANERIEEFEDEDSEILSMSKSERRRARKLAKRAARAQKAA